MALFNLDNFLESTTTVKSLTDLRASIDATAPQVTTAVTFLTTIGVIWFFIALYYMSQGEDKSIIFKPVLFLVVLAIYHTGKPESGLKVGVSAATFGFLFVGISTIRSNKERGSRAERRVISEYGMANESYLARRFKKIRKHSRKLIYKIHDPRTDQEKIEDKQLEEDMLEEERKTEMELHEEAIAAGSRKIADATKAMILEELAEEDKEKLKEEALKHAVEVISNLKNSKNLDTVATDYILNYTQIFLKAFEDITDEEVIQDKFRKNTLKILDDMAKMIKKSAENARDLDKEAEKLGKKLMRAGSKQIAKLEEKIQAKATSISKMAEYVNKKQGVTDEVTLEKMRDVVRKSSRELMNYKQVLQKLQSLDSQLRTMILGYNVVLKKIRKDLEEVSKSEEIAIKLEEEAKKYEEGFAIDLAKMKDATHTFHASMAHISDGKESVNIIATVIMSSIGEFFKELETLKTKTINLEQGYLYKFETAIVPVMKEAAQVQSGITYLSRAHYYMTRAYEDLDQIAIDTMSNKEVEVNTKLAEDYKAQVLAEKADVNEVKQGEAVKDALKKAYDTLVQSVGDMKKHIDELKSDLSSQQNLEKNCLDSLQSLIEAFFSKIDKNTKKLLQDSEQTRANLAMAQAREKQAKAETVASV